MTAPSRPPDASPVRLVAPLVVLALTACTPAGEPDLVMHFTDESNEAGTSRGDASVDFGVRSHGCWYEESLRLENLGAAPARFRLSAPSAAFQYDAGPYELSPGAMLELPLRVDLRGDLPDSSRFEHELAIEQARPPERRSFRLQVLAAISDFDVPVRDFGAVVIGETGVLESQPLQGVTPPFFMVGGTLHFQPTEVGPQWRSASWLYRPNCRPVPAFLRGEGVRQRIERVDPASLDFGVVPVGTSIAREVTWTLWTNEAAMVTTPAGVQDMFSAEERVEAFEPMRRDEQGVLQPARRVTVVRFAPTVQGPRSGQLVLSVGSAQAVVSLRGVGGP